MSFKITCFACGASQTVFGPTASWRCPSDDTTHPVHVKEN